VKTRLTVVLFALLTLPVVPLAAQNGPAIEMQVKTILVDPANNAPVVILESNQDKKLLPIWIGTNEAQSIAMQLEKVDSPRPNTHDLIRNILQGLGATLQRIVITDLRNSTYYATVHLRLKGHDFPIDSRPSDAIAVALRMKASIFATPQVLAKARPIPGPAKQRDFLREMLGVHLQDLTPELASLLDIQGATGVLVADVELGSAAFEAGLQRGDVIVKANDKTVQKAAQIEVVLKSLARPGRVKFDVLRKGKPATVLVDVPA
jgi:bifunctional DNase/RNase